MGCPSFRPLSAAVDAPITSALYQVIFEDRQPAEAVRELMTRPWRAEPEDWQ